jgi:hypothetical protein
MTEEHQRLESARQHKEAWKQWGPYLSERQWGTVRTRGKSPDRLDRSGKHSYFIVRTCDGEGVAGRSVRWRAEKSIHSSATANSGENPGIA